MKTCCTPARADAGDAPPAREPGGKRRSPGDVTETVDIPGGTALVGTASPHFATDGEGPLRRKKLAPFRIGATTVTNAEFQSFCDATGYETEAQRFGNSLVFQGLLPPGSPATHAVADAPWWRLMPGAHWRKPIGPDGHDALADHPVVHVSWNDANAFCAWAGAGLPSEAEWEHAARGGLGDVPFPWGSEQPDDATFQPCNIWQGRFPHQDLGLDGYVGTAPARTFDANGYGLFNAVGNVWEWTSEPFKVRSLKKSVKAQHAAKAGFKLCKGGSFLCHKSYCYRYRIAARNSSSANSSTSHIGFRVVFDVT